MSSCRIDGDLFSVPAFTLIFYISVNQSKERVIASPADIISRMYFRSALPENDRARARELTVGQFHAQPFGPGIAPVLCGASGLFGSEKLYINSQHKLTSFF